MQSSMLPRNGLADIVGSQRRRFYSRILEGAKQAETVWSADAVLLGGAPFSGFSSALASEADLPLFDGLTSAVSQLLVSLSKNRKTTH
jgi:Asp/Glu/hydantoin racemase